MLSLKTFSSVTNPTKHVKCVDLLNILVDVYLPFILTALYAELPGQTKIQDSNQQNNYFLVSRLCRRQPFR